MAGLNSLGTLSARVALDTTPLSAGMKTAGLAFAAVAAGAAAAIFKVGSDYEQSLNTFQAVSQASAEQMRQVGATAKQLGADMSLPATSAGDAAKAMTELAKSGLSVEEALSAAKGTLQLAAAAQIDEAKAAEITANALNMFKLKGTEAGRVADLLAASANASSAEITDMADALAMSGSVFASAGVPIEDLITMLGQLANEGIKGQQAGTALKQMMLSLEGPSKPAAAAIRAMGVDIYDAGGKMYSTRNIIDQFNQATKKMTQEQRDMAFATIFGSDAVRAANVIYGQGAVAFDGMKEAVTRLNAAKELAEAKTKGLKGAMEGLVSQLETVALTIYAKVAPAIEGFARRIADAFPKVVEAVGTFWKTMTDGQGAFRQLQNDMGLTSNTWYETFALAIHGIADKIGDVFRRIVGVVQEHMPAIKDAIRDLKDTIIGIGDAAKPVLDTLFAAFNIAGPIAAGIVVTIVDGLGALGRWVSANEGPVKIIAGILTALLIPALISIGVTSTISAAKSAAAWVIMEAKAIAGAIVHGVQVALIVGGWILMGITAMAQAAVVAAAWLISLGPIALVVAAVIGLAVVFVKNWDTIKSAVLTGVIFVVDKVLGMAEWITRAAAAAFGWVPGIGDKLKDAARAVESFRDDVNTYLDGIRDKTIRVTTVYTSTTVDQDEGTRYAGAQRYAEGGIVDKPTFALIGEAGKELVLPLTNMRRTFQLLNQAGLVKPFAMPSANAGGAGATASESMGSGAASIVQHIYPSAGMDERALGAAAAREMA